MGTPGQVLGLVRGVGRRKVPSVSSHQGRHLLRCSPTQGPEATAASPSRSALCAGHVWLRASSSAPGPGRDPCPGPPPGSEPQGPAPPRPVPGPCPREWALPAGPAGPARGEGDATFLALRGSKHSQVEVVLRAGSLAAQALGRVGPVLRHGAAGPAARCPWPPGAQLPHPAWHPGVRLAPHRSPSHPAAGLGVATPGRLHS